MTGIADPKSVQIAAYYFPGYHADPRTDAAHGAGWTEWELVKRGEPRFPGHAQPKVPLWGYEDEASTEVFARKIAAAADHGVDFFIFDWYWYDDGPFLNLPLDAGFLRASNNDRLKFALMWANHDWVDIHPAKLSTPPGLLYPGAVTRETFDTLTQHVIRDYFTHPSYWKIDGCPYFSVYELYRLVQGLGGAEAAVDALRGFRERTRAAGFPDLHLNAVIWGIQILPGEHAFADPSTMVSALGFDSVTSYVWIHHLTLTDFPATDYRWATQEAAAHWRRAAAEFDLPYYPNVTMGWDSSPRAIQSDRFVNRGYPFMPALVRNSPEAFREALVALKDYLSLRPEQPRIFTVNAWNEWTEGSYLEPDTVHGMAYLEAIRSVFRPDRGVS